MIPQNITTQATYFHIFAALGAVLPPSLLLSSSSHGALLCIHHKCSYLAVSQPEFSSLKREGGRLTDKGMISRLLLHYFYDQSPSVEVALASLRLCCTVCLWLVAAAQECREMSSSSLFEHRGRHRDLGARRCWLLMTESWAVWPDWLHLLCI